MYHPCMTNPLHYDTLPGGTVIVTKTAIFQGVPWPSPFMTKRDALTAKATDLALSAATVERIKFGGWAIFLPASA